MTASLEVTSDAFYHHFSDKDEHFVFLIEAQSRTSWMAITRTNKALYRIGAALDAILPTSPQTLVFQVRCTRLFSILFALRLSCRDKSVVDRLPLKYSCWIGACTWGILQ